MQRLLGWHDLRGKGILKSRAQINRDIRAGVFPRPVYPGRSPAWVEAEVDEHIAALIKKRDATMAR
jgi:predicted DNA-binding transcriptional regulator AlpA